MNELYNTSKAYKRRGDTMFETLFASDWIGLLLVGLGTLFLLGEILVNLRGFFALLGIGFIVLYFYTF